MLHRLLGHAVRAQSGITLIEIIVVVGIIALLAAVIVPNIGKFVGSGSDSAKNVEQHNLEQAFAIIMAETQQFKFTAHDASNSSTATNSWTDLPKLPDGSAPKKLPGGEEVSLEGYLVSASTVYYYCFDGGGKVTEQFETAEACTLSP